VINTITDQLQAERIRKVVPLSVRIEPEAVKKLEEIAMANHASLSGLIRISVARFLEEYEKDNSAAASTRNQQSEGGTRGERQ
jgi:predicted transcriptional regulator